MKNNTPTTLGAIQIKTNKFLIRQTELSLAQNVSSDILGSWKTRLGHTQTGNTLQSGKDILGLFGDLNTNGKHLAVVNNSGDTNSVLKYLNGATWTNITGATTLPANAEVNFTSFLDTTYIVGKNSDNSYLTTATLTGITHGTESSFPKAADIKVYFDQLYLFDCEVGGVRYGSRVYRSSIPTYSGGWVISFDTDTDFIQLNTDDGDYLTGGARSYGNLLAFKNYSVWGIDSNGNKFPLDGVGCTSPKSIVEDDLKDVYYHHFSSKHKGVYKWDGSRSQKVSRPVEPFIEGSSGTGVVGGIYNDHILEFIGDVTLNEDIAEYYGLPTSFSNVLLDYSTQDETWVVHTLPTEITRIAPNGDNLYFGDNTGKIFRWNLGTADDTTPIEAIVCTHNYYGQTQEEFNLRKTFNEIIINMHKQTLAKAFYSVDNVEWIPLGQLKGKVNVFSISAKGYGIKTKVSSNSGTFIYEGNEITYTLEQPLKKK